MVIRAVPLPSRLSFAPASRRIARADVLCASGVLLFALFVARWFYGSYAFDDSFVGYAIAKNLLEGHGFAFDPGVRALTTSAPLAPLVYALFARLARADVVDVAQAFAAVAYVLLGPLAYRIFRYWSAPAGATLAALSLVASPFVAMLWSHESLLALFACALGTLCVLNGRTTLAAAAFGAAVLLRQESILPLGVAAIALWRRDGLLDAGRFLALALAPTCAWALYAIPAFGTIFSQTMAVKIAMATYPGIESYAIGLADFAATCFRASRADQTYGAAILALALVVVTVAAASLAGTRPSRASLAVGAASSATIALYVGLHVAFFAWFCVPVALLVALAVALPFQCDVAATKSPLLRCARTAAVVLAFLNVTFAARLITGEFDTVDLTGFFPASHFRDGGYRAMGALLANLPPDAVIAYEEPGQLRYYSGRTILDYQGMTHPGTAAYLQRHHPEWTLQRYRPEYFLLDVDDRNVMLDPRDLPWFAQAYRDATGVVRVDRRGTRSRFRLYRLVRPEAIPPLPF